MKNKIIVFIGALIVASLISSCGSDDNDNTNETPSSTTESSASVKYKDVKQATYEINSMVQSAISGSTNAGRIAKNGANDCMTITSEVNEIGATAIIDYENNCIVNGNTISGKIILTYKIKEGSGSLAFDMTYTLENFSFNNIIVNGKSVATYNLGDLTTGDEFKFITTSDYVFTWEDGLKVTSTANTSISTVINNEQPNESYSVVTFDTEAKFSTGETLISKTTSPLRLENECQYVVSGIIITSEDETVSNTLDYGDGACDNIAIQTDNDGNETTIDLDVEVAENFTI